MKPLLVCAICVLPLAYSCTEADKYDLNTTDKYESTKTSLAATEEKYPARFIKPTGSNRKNLLGQMVVKGNLANTGKVVSYKDVEIKLSFYSKTGSLLEEDRETVYETIVPGGNKNFKSKYFTPKGTDSVAITVVGAKY